MQRYILIDGYKIKQPDSFTPNWATTYTEDSERTMAGKAYLEPMFTNESYSYEASDLTADEAKNLLQRILPKRGKPNFNMTYYSWYYGEWRTDKFYVSQGSMNIKSLRDNYEALESISFDIIGVNPI